MGCYCKRRRIKKSRYDDHESKIRLNSFTGNHFWGCDDNTAGLGLGMFPGSDQNINGKLSTFDVTTESVHAGKIYAMTNVGYVGKFTDETFGTYQAGFLAQLNCPEGMTFPEAFSGTTESGTGKMMTDFKNLAEGVSGNYTIIEDEKGNPIGNCQINIYLWYDSYFGDSLTACRLSMYVLDKKKATSIGMKTQMLIIPISTLQDIMIVRQVY